MFADTQTNMQPLIIYLRATISRSHRRAARPVDRAAWFSMQLKSYKCWKKFLWILHRRVVVNWGPVKEKCIFIIFYRIYFEVCSVTKYLIWFCRLHLFTIELNLHCWRACQRHSKQFDPSFLAWCLISTAKVWNIYTPLSFPPPPTYTTSFSTSVFYSLSHTRMIYFICIIMRFNEWGM